MKILLSIDKTKTEIPDAQRQWHDYIAELQRIADTVPSIQTLGEGTWMLTDETAFPLLWHHIRKTGVWKFPYRLGFLRQAQDIEFWSCKPSA